MMKVEVGGFEGEATEDRSDVVRLPVGQTDLLDHGDKLFRALQPQAVGKDMSMGGCCTEKCLFRGRP